MGAADLERRFAGLEAFPRSVSTPQEPEKYAASGLTSADRAALYDRAREALHEKALYLQPDLTLRDLAAAIGAPPRDVSEAVNGAGAQSFFEFVNLARVAHAQALLLREPQTRILDIAFRSGFNSKSAFNETFKKSAGVTPSEFRRGRDSSQKTGRSAENPAPGTS
jgi:AraC-like DNA-binding protein